LVRPNIVLKTPYWATQRREAMPLPLQPASIPPNSPSNP
jgi:hypothetical protein